MERCLEEMGARYYRYLKLGERSVSAEERRWLDKILLKAQRELILKPKIVGGEFSEQSNEPAKTAQSRLLVELRQRLGDESDDSILLSVFTLMCILELVGAVLLPTYTWRAGNKSVLFAILMVMTGLIGGSIVAMVIAMPVWQFYDFYRRRKIARLIAKIATIERLYNVELISSDTFPSVE